MSEKELFGNSEQLDTISRQAAIDVIEAGRLTKLIDAETAVNGLKALPSAQTGRKKGKWLPDNNNYYEERFICSVCGKSYKVDTCMGKPMWEFCPCGADMRGKQDE